MCAMNSILTLHIGSRSIHTVYSHACRCQCVRVAGDLMYTQADPELRWVAWIAWSRLSLDEAGVLGIGLGLILCHAYCTITYCIVESVCGKLGL